MTPQDPTSPPTAEQEPPPPRRLLRPADDRMLAGVASGLGRYFDLDANLVRIGLLVLALFGGSGIAIYVVLALIVPSEDGEAYVSTASGASRKLLLAALVVIALISLPFAGFGFLFAAPAVITLVVLGALAVLIWRAVGGQADNRLTRAALLILAVAGSVVLGLGAGVATAFGGGTIVAGVVIAAGAALIIGGIVGGARWLAIPALLMAVPLVVVSAADLDLRGGVGDREYRPASVTDLRDGYRLGAGELRLDVRDVELPPGRTEVDLEIGAGRIELAVPEDVCVQARVHVGAGRIEAFDGVNHGVDVGFEAAPVPVPDGPVLVVDAEAGLGEIDIDHEPSREEWGGFHDGDDDDDDPQVACSR